MTTPHLGKCALCEEERELQNSHLMPQWAYKRIQQAGQDHPILVSNGKAVQTSQQIMKYLLCSDCEGKFSRAEDYVARLTEVDQDEVLTIMSSLDQEGAPQNGWAIVRNDLDIEKVVYFAASIIWRSAVMSDGDGCKLGKYVENFRRYLSGVADFPSELAVHMIVLKPSELIKKPQRYFTFPSSLKTPTQWLHGFTICGLAFRCFVGSSLNTIVKTTNLGGDSSIKYAVMMTAEEFSDFHEVSRISRAAIPRGKLAKQPLRRIEKPR